MGVCVGNPCNGMFTSLVLTKLSKYDRDMASYPIQLGYETFFAEERERERDTHLSVSFMADVRSRES